MHRFVGCNGGREYHLRLLWKRIHQDLLEPMSGSIFADEVGGFTLVELIVAVAITAILATLAVPSFSSLFAKKRVEGLIAELATDLQYARSEAITRNTMVQLTMGTNCYVIHALPTTATVASSATSCTQSAASPAVIGLTELKTVQVAAGRPESFSPASGSIVFDPVRGTATISSAGTITATSSIGSWDLRANLSAVGRVNVCSPAGTGNVAGYAAC